MLPDRRPTSGVIIGFIPDYTAAAVGRNLRWWPPGRSSGLANESQAATYSKASSSMLGDGLPQLQGKGT